MCNINICVTFSLLRCLDLKNLFYYSTRKLQYLRKNANICENLVISCLRADGQTDMSKPIADNPMYDCMQA